MPRRPTVRRPERCARLRMGVAGILAGLVLSGCALPRPGAGADGAIPDSPVEGPQVEPLGGLVGRVISVRADLRFVVVDFGLNRLPGPGTPLEVERDGSVVGRLRAGRDARGGILVADWVEGEAAAGDRVRIPRRRDVEAQ